MSLKKIVLGFFLSLFVLVQFPAVVLATAISVTGKAKVLNTNNSYLDFTNYSSNATVDDTTGNFSGYAFLEDVGWVAFGTTDNSLGPVDANLVTGKVTGKAKALNTGAYLDFTNYNSSVTLTLSSGVFSGHVFSEDAGWINFSDTGVSLSTATINSFGLDSPSDKSYTNSERPSFKWKGGSDAASGLSKYVLEIDNPSAGSGQPSGDFIIDDIPVSRTMDYETNKYLIHYENFSDSDNNNDYISVYTKSSSEWSTDSNTGQNDGKLREGKVSWKVKARDNAGNETSSSRTLFVDRSGPKVEFTQINDKPFSSNTFSTTDKTPTIYGKITDILSGGDSSQTQNENGPRVASGPKQVEIKLEQKQGLTYKLHTLYTINIDKSWYTCDNTEVTDNSKQKCDKYLPFEHIQKENLPLGTYRVTLSGKDKADNSAAEVSFTLKVTTFAQLTTPEERKTIKEELEITKPTEPQEPGEVEKVTSKIVEAIANAYWQIVDSIKALAGAGVKLAGNIATLWQAYSDFVQDTNQKALAFVNIQLGKLGRSIASSYNYLAENSPEIVGNILISFRNTLASLASTVSALAQSTSQALIAWVTGFEKFVAATAGPSIGSIGQFAYRQQVKLLSIAEILFDKNPTVITNVKVVEVGKDYVVITWETNHYTTNNKVNYGNSLSYGQDVVSQERARHHEFKIIGLEVNKKYFFEVMSKNKNYVYDAYHEFVTKPQE